MAQSELRATETAPSVKSVAAEILGQGKRLSNLVSNLEVVLCRAGLRDRTPEPDKATVDEPEPDELRWILNDANTRVRIATNRFEELAAIVEKELT